MRINYLIHQIKILFMKKLKKLLIIRTHTKREDSSASSSDGESRSSSVDGFRGCLPIGNSPISIKTLVKKLLIFFQTQKVNHHYLHQNQKKQAKKK